MWIARDKDGILGFYFNKPVKGINEWSPMFEDETIMFAYIEQEDVIRKILEYSTDDGLTRETIFKKHYLDIENLYRNNGWEVEYKKPMSDEYFKAYFVFKSKKDKF